MNELTRDTKVIGAEVRALTAQAKYMTLFYGVEIGRRLKEAKAAVPYGQFGRFLEEETDFSSSSAARFMKLFEEYAPMLEGNETDFPTLGKVSVSNALSLLAVPEEERENFAEEHNVEAISNRELEKLIKERDEAIKRAEEAETAKAEVEALMEETERERDEAEEKLNEVEDKLKGLQTEYDAVNSGYDELEKEVEELRSRPVDVAVEVDEEAVKKAAEEARAEAEKEWKAKLSEAEQAAEAAALKMDELTGKLSAAQEKLMNAGADDRAEKERLEKEVENLSKRLMMSDCTVAIFQVHFDSVQKAWKELRRLLDEMSTEQRPKMGAALKALAAKINEEAAKC